MPRLLLTLIILVSFFSLQAQVKQDVSNAHSHNDYEQKRPFALAYENGFGSLEADVWLKDGKLCVAHDAKDIDIKKTISGLYFEPLLNKLKANKGHVYLNRKKKLQLLIDIKSEAKTTLEALIKELENYPDLIRDKNLKIVISGNRPKPENYKNYPAFIFFDGRPNEEYDKKALKKVGLISESYFKYARWNGKGDIAANERSALLSAVQKAHEKGKPFRFWATPDTESSWKLFMELGVDYINTDKVEGLARFLGK
jgi:alkaline phosphatase